MLTLHHHPQTRAATVVWIPATMPARTTPASGPGNTFMASHGAMALAP